MTSSGIEVFTSLQLSLNSCQRNKSVTVLSTFLMGTFYYRLLAFLFRKVLPSFTNFENRFKFKTKHSVNSAKIIVSTAKETFIKHRCKIQETNFAMFFSTSAWNLKGFVISITQALYSAIQLSLCFNMFMQLQFFLKINCLNFIYCYLKKFLKLYIIEEFSVTSSR